MRSRLLQGLAVTGALGVLSGCAFTQWTDHAYLGSVGDPPSHANRQWAGAVILPFAVIGDILTAPAQLVALLVMGDGGLYAQPNGRVVVDEPGLESGMTRLEPAMKDALLSVAAASPSVGTGLRVWGVDADHHTIEIPLTSSQQAALAARLDSVAPRGGA